MNAVRKLLAGCFSVCSTLLSAHPQCCTFCLCIGDTPHRFTSCPIALTLSSGAPVAPVWDIFSNVIATFLTRQSCYLPFVRVHIHQLGQRRHCQRRDLFSASCSVRYRERLLPSENFYSVRGNCTLALVGHTSVVFPVDLSRY